MKTIIKAAGMLILTTAVNAHAANIDVNQIDCSIGQNSGRVDRVLATANDDTGAVKLMGWKNGVKTDETVLSSENYVLLSKKDLAQNPAASQIAQQIAKRIKVDFSKTETLVRFTVSGDDFFLLKFVSAKAELGSAMTILGTTYPCK
ncbi:MAG: hypothetical protein ACXWRE_04295 [Pseudobdellovibrionaceae bacterium]